MRVRKKCTPSGSASSELFSEWHDQRRTPRLIGTVSDEQYRDLAARRNRRYCHLPKEFGQRSGPNCPSCAKQKLVSRLQNELVHLHHLHGKWFLHHDFVVGRISLPCNPDPQ